MFETHKFHVKKSSFSCVSLCDIKMLRQVHDVASLAWRYIRDVHNLKSHSLTSFKSTDVYKTLSTTLIKVTDEFL